MAPQLIITGALLIASTLAFTAEPITGAFGQILGETYNSHDQQGHQINGIIRYTFKPSTPNDKWYEYFVGVTPIKEKIIVIGARGKTHGEVDCLKKQAYLLIDLRKKHGGGPYPADPLTVHQGSKQISVYCGPAPGYELSINYADAELFNSSETERRQLKEAF